MSKKGIKPQFKQSQYTPQYLMKQELKILRQEYTLIRDIMNKRYKRLKQAGYETNFTQAVESWGELPKLSTLKKLAGGDEIQLKREVSYWLAEMKRYDTVTSTVKFQKTKRKELATALQKAGYNVSPGEVQQFGDFMDIVRMTGIDMMLYSETYKESETGYRSQRLERTDEEKSQVMSLFDRWKKEKALPLDILIR